MAVLWCPIRYSQEARSYSALLLFSMLAMYFWLSMLLRPETENRTPYPIILAYLGSAVVCSYLHYFGFYLVLLQALFTLLLIIFISRRFTFVLLANLIAICCFLPWIKVMFDTLRIQSFWIPQPTPAFFIDYLGFLFNTHTNLSAARGGSFDLLYIVIPLYAGLSIREIVSFVRRRSTEKWDFGEMVPTVILLLWLTVPFLGAYLKSIYSTSVLTERNLIISLPAAYLLLARSITVLVQNSLLRAFVVVIIVIVFLRDLLVVGKYYETTWTPQYREAVEFILANENVHPNSIIVGCSGQRHPLKILDHYFQRFGSSRTVDLLFCEKEDMTNLETAIRVRKPDFIWWLVAGVRQPDRSLISMLGERCVLIHHQRFFGANVLIYKVVRPERKLGGQE